MKLNATTTSSKNSPIDIFVILIDKNFPIFDFFGVTANVIPDSTFAIRLNTIIIPKKYNITVNIIINYILSLVLY